MGEYVPRLLPWLREAAKEIEIAPSEAHEEWRVLVTNGEGGHEAAATIIARCTSQPDAELVAHALRFYAKAPSDPGDLDLVERLMAGLGRIDDA